MQPPPIAGRISIPMLRRFMMVVGLGLLGFLASLGLTKFAAHMGFLFEGLTSFFSVVMATVACWVVTGVVAVMGMRRGRPLSSPMLMAVPIMAAAVVVGLWSWFSTRDQLRALFMNPLPKGVHVHRGQDALFRSWVHFSASPEVMAAIIRSKQLTPPVDEDEKQNEQRSMNGSPHGLNPEWWLPGALEKPRFFLHMHNDSLTPWIQGLWVNEAMTEAYAFIKG